MTGRPTTRITKRATAVFFGALLLFAVGTNVQAGWVLVVAAFLAGMLVVGMVLPFRALHGIEVERRAPRSVVAGDTIEVTLDITNTSRRPRSLFRVTDDFCGRAFAVVVAMGAGQTRRYTSTRTGARRGVYGGGRAELVSGMPFGFVRVMRSDEIGSPIVVYPKVFDATAIELVGPSGVPAPASVGDVSTIRDYRPGDPLRHIHWRSVARRGQLVVREFDQERSATTAIVAAVPDDADLADAVASVACSLAIAGLRDGEVSLEGERVRGSDAILEWGARLGPRSSDAATQIANASRADALVFVGTTSLAPVEAIAAQASSTSASVVLIDDGTPSDVIASRLRAAGCAVAVVPHAVLAHGIGSWIGTGSVAS